MRPEEVEIGREYKLIPHGNVNIVAACNEALQNWRYGSIVEAVFPPTFDFGACKYCDGPGVQIKELCSGDSGLVCTRSLAPIDDPDAEQTTEEQQEVVA